MDLSEFLEIAKAAAPALRTVDVDLSETAGQTFTITLSELDAPRIFQVNEDANVLKKQNSDFPHSLCIAVAILAQAHTAPTPPQGLTRAQFYCHLARSSRQLLSRLLSEYGTAFPESVGSEDEAAAKNGLEGQEVASCSSVLPTSISTPGNAPVSRLPTSLTSKPTTLPRRQSKAKTAE